MTEKSTKAPIIGDRWLIIIALTLVAITAWNSRYTLIPTPAGYTRYAKHGISFLYPDDLNLWEVVVFEDGSFDISISVSEDIGTVGWNSGNTDNPQPHTTHWRESSVIWLQTEPPEDFELHLFYNQLYANALRNRREINMTKGETSTFTHMNHQGLIQFFNYTIQDIGTHDKSQVYGIVTGYYCDKTGRTIEVYYIDIYDSDPVYDKESLFKTFRFYLGSVYCH